MKIILWCMLFLLFAHPSFSATFEIETLEIAGNTDLILTSVNLNGSCLDFSLERVDNISNPLVLNWSLKGSFPATCGNASRNQFSYELGNMEMDAGSNIVFRNVEAGAVCYDLNLKKNDTMTDLLIGGMSWHLGGVTPVVCQSQKEKKTYYRDLDGDGFGDPDQSGEFESQPEGYVENGMDCDDTALQINPDASEIRDGLDNDCDGAVDEDLFDDAGVIYSETFSSDPGFKSLDSNYAYWDINEGNYYVRTFDNLLGKYWAYSPHFDGADPQSADLTVTMDILIENQNWGTYPGVRFYNNPPDDISDSSAVFSIVNGNADRNRELIQVCSTQTCYKSPQWSIKDGTWYTVSVTSMAAGTKADILIKEKSTGSTVSRFENVDFAMTPFRYMGVGYYNKPDYGSDWAPIRVDNIRIAASEQTSAPAVVRKFGDFAITAQTYEDSADWDRAVADELGPGYRVLDWSDLETYYAGGGDLTALLNGLGLISHGSGGFVYRNGSKKYSSNRYYFISRHDHQRPGSYLAHENLDNFMVSLGSWYTTRPILAIKTESHTPSFKTFGNFAITSNSYADAGDWEQAVAEEMGPDYRVLDWSDLEAYYAGGGDLTALLNGLGLISHGSGGFVYRNGSKKYSSNRYYFISRHDHQRPGSYLAHENLDNFMISLGSWYTTRPILAIKR